MEPASFALAVVGGVELCLKYGSKLYDICRTYQGAEQATMERILKLQNRWLKIEVQIRFLHDVWPDLPSRFQVHYGTLLSVINSKLFEATVVLDRSVGDKSSNISVSDLMGKEGRVHRGAFTFGLKSKLDGIIKDLDSWQQDMLDPSWYQLIFIPSQRMDQRVAEVEGHGPLSTLKSLRDLARDSNKGGDELMKDTMNRDSIEFLSSEIEFSQSKLGIEKSSGRLVVLDAVVLHRHLPTNKPTEDARYLTRRLSLADSDTFGLLRCCGVMDPDVGPTSMKETDFYFVFSFPQNYDDPTSLRRLLLDADPTYPLNSRFHIAQRLAKSTMFLHACQIVHKGIRPDNVICFGKQGGTPDNPFLIGFERFRMAGLGSSRQSDEYWHREIYRHPSRQGARPEQDYNMKHDIYSLGVCLLELGLWKSFFGPTYRLNKDSVVTMSDFLVKDPRKRAFAIKKKLVKTAEEQLPGCMGQQFASVVVSCLTCLDPDNNDFGDEEDPAADSVSLIGVAYAEQVLLRLLSISV